VSPRPKLVIAEDEAALAKVLKLRLEMEGFHVRVAGDGAEAMRLVREDPPDLLVCDLMMPVMDGFAVTRELKADPALSSLPILILTALKRENDVAELTRLGVSGFASKPYDSKALTAQIRELVAPR
jgi:DNA-binding response OmpR family regulator